MVIRRGAVPVAAAHSDGSSKPLRSISKVCAPLDTRATPDQARRVAGAMGANGKLILYSSVPHMAIVEARPDEWRRDVADFLGALR